jgi:hypothetical protein
LQPSAERLLLAATQDLSHAQEDGAAVGDQDGIEDVDRVRPVRLGLGVLDHLDAGVPQQIHERVVLAPGRLEIGAGGVVPARRIGVAEGLVGTADEDPPQGGDHALTAIELSHPRSSSS